MAKRGNGEITELGGISAIAVSHPHFYGVMTEWGRVFDAPVYVHAADRDWVARPDPVIDYWTGDTHPIAPGMTLVNAGTHVAGGTVLHWTGDPEGRGAPFSGDICAGRNVRVRTRLRRVLGPGDHGRRLSRATPLRRQYLRFALDDA